MNILPVLLIALAVFAGIGPSAKGADPSLPALRLSGWKLDVIVPDDAVDGRERSGRFNLILNLVNESLWNVAWCEEKKARVTAEDAEGGRRNLDAMRWYSDGGSKGCKVGSMHLELNGWPPAEAARWVRIKGEVPIVVSLRDAVTDPVTVKLEKGFSVPVILKGAGLPGAGGNHEDARATLTVKEYRDAGEKGKKWLKLDLAADRLFCGRELELTAMNGEPSSASRKRSTQADGVSGWSVEWEMEAVPEGELKVVVRYAQHPRRAVAVVDCRVGVFGFVEGKEGDEGEKVGHGPVRSSEMAGNGLSENGGKKNVAMPAVAGATAVTARLTSWSIYNTAQWVGNALREMPFQLYFYLQLEAGKTFSFGGSAELAKQSLEVTDSTGCVLKPAEFDLDRLALQEEEGDCVHTGLSGCGSELPAAGAEWVRLRGTLRVPVARVRESPVYELPLVQGAEEHVPVPGMEKDLGGEDVAMAGDAPVYRLWLKKVEREADGTVGVDVALSWEGAPFNVDDVILVDGKGEVLLVKSLPLGGSGNDEDQQGKRVWWFDIPNASDMKKLRVKLKCRTGAETVAVPVDVKVGLGGVVPWKKAGVRKQDSPVPQKSGTKKG